MQPEDLGVLGMEGRPKGARRLSFVPRPAATLLPIQVARSAPGHRRCRTPHLTLQGGDFSLLSLLGPPVLAASVAPIVFGWWWSGSGASGLAAAVSLAGSDAGGAECHSPWENEGLFLDKGRESWGGK